MVRLRLPQVPGRTGNIFSLYYIILYEGLSLKMNFMKYALLCLLYFVIFCSGCTRTPEQIITEKADLFDQFEDKFGRFHPESREQYEGSDLQHDLIESITQFEKLIKKHPDNYDLKTIYGMLNSYAHNLDIAESFEKSEDALNEAISMDSSRWEAYFHLGNLYVHSPATISQGLDNLFKALKNGKENTNSKVYLYIAEGFFFNALNMQLKNDTTPGEMKYYRLKKPGKYKFISDSLNYLQTYLHKNPYDTYAAELSIILNNHYWGKHIIRTDSGSEFINSIFGYRFIIPQEWILLRDNYEKGFVMLNIPNTEPDGIVNSNAVAIAIEKNPAGGTVESFIKDIKKRAGINTSSDKEVAGSFVLMNTSYKNQAGNIQTKNAFCVKNGYRYFISFVSTVNSYQKNEPLFTEFVKSIQIY
ncbi:MAG: tetratricopeptide repeat protein [Spirochaetota bacterium]